MQINTNTTSYKSGEIAHFIRSRDQHGKLSNMTFGFPLKVNGLCFQGPEGLYQALKFPHDSEHQKLIAGERSGMEAKRRAYQNSSTRPDWDDVKVDAMAYTLAQKLSQHPGEFSAALLTTGENPIVEMSHRDSFWGAKPEQGYGILTGINVLGQLLTILREQLRRHDSHPGAAAAAYLKDVETGKLSINRKKAPELFPQERQRSPGD